MIINIGTGVDESVVMWKYNDKDKWRDADIDELIHLYESVVLCKNCRYYECGGLPCPLDLCESLGDDGFCSRGERKEPLPQYEEWQDEFNKMCESATPKTFVADEWYRDTFGENNGK